VGCTWLVAKLALMGMKGIVGAARDAPPIGECEQRHGGGFKEDVEGDGEHGGGAIDESSDGTQWKHGPNELTQDECECGCPEEERRGFHGLDGFGQSEFKPTHPGVAG
jgi:hypothetical protein